MTQPINKKAQAKPTAKTAVKPQSKPQTKPAPKKKPLFSFGKKNKSLSAQNSIRYREMGSDGICRVDERFYSKTIRFLDINYQLAQKDDKTAIFENWCDFLNYFDSSIQVQLSFINHHTDMKEFEKMIDIPLQNDAFDDVRREYAQMLKNQLAKGNNGLVKSKFITFGIEAESIKKARPKLERIEADILGNFKVLGVTAFPLNGVERLKVLYETFDSDTQEPFRFRYDMMMQSGLTTKDYVAPSSFDFREGKYFRMGKTMGAVSYLQILAPELTDRMLAEFLDVEHMFAHMSYHFLSGGCGVRSLTDIWVMERKMNMTYVDAEDLLREAGIYQFAKEMTSLVDACFSGKEKNELQEAMLAFIFHGGTYGSLENNIAINNAKTHVNLRYIFKRIWIPCNSLAMEYPILNKHRFLYLFCWVHRSCKLSIRLLKNMLGRRKVGKSVSEDQTKESIMLRKHLGL